VTPLVCAVCDYRTDRPEAKDLGEARGNTERFRTQVFRLWQCPTCLAIHNVDPVDLTDIYREYPLNKRRLDVFALGTLSNLLRRLTDAGLTRDASILDVGCGENAVMIEFLRKRGFSRVTGYDPYTSQYAGRPDVQFDCVIVNDVIEHLEAPTPRAFASAWGNWVKPGGLMYIGTADTDGVDMSNLEPELMRLHQPFHRVIFSQAHLESIARQTGLSVVASYRRSYMDTWRPFSNYRFLNEFSAALGHVVDRSLAPDAGKVLLKRPQLLWYAFFGYWMPCAYEPAVVLRKPPAPGP
jgi:SAM-dependent methyltransferase